MLGSNMRQFLALILTISLIFPATLFAQESENNNVEVPKVMEINLGEPAPFTGVLLNSSAAAQMLTNQKFSEQQCKLRVDFELSKLKAQNDLLLNSVRASLEATENKYASILSIKDAEIDRLSKIALESSSDHSEWWAAGGFLVGTLVALGIFFAAAEAGK